MNGSKRFSMPRTLTSYMFFCNDGEYDEQIIFTLQFWWKYSGLTKITNIRETNNQRTVKNKKAWIQLNMRQPYAQHVKMQYQKKCRPSENTNNITIHNITVQPPTETKIWGNLSIMDLQQVVSSTWGSHKMEKELIYAAFRKGR